MKEISESIKKLTPEDFKELAGRLQLKNKSKKDLVGALTTVTGLHALLKSLDSNCHRVLKVVYGAPGRGPLRRDPERAETRDTGHRKDGGILCRCLLLYTNQKPADAQQQDGQGLRDIRRWRACCASSSRRRSPTGSTRTSSTLKRRSRPSRADKALKDREMRARAEIHGGIGVHRRPLTRRGTGCRRNRRKRY